MTPTAVSALGRVCGGATAIAEIGGCTVSERTDIGAVLVSACRDDFGPVASAVLAFELPARPGAFSRGDNILALWLSPRSWIIQCRPEDEERLIGMVEAAFPDHALHAAAFSDCLCWIELSGPNAEAVLRRHGFISFEPGFLPVGSGKRTLVARINAVVIRVENERFLLGVERSHARYLASWLVHPGNGI